MKTLHKLHTKGRLLHVLQLYIKLQIIYSLPCCDIGNFRTLYPACEVTNFDFMGYLNTQTVT